MWTMRFFFQCRTAQTMASPSLMGTGNWSSRFQFSTSSLPSCEIFRICGCGGVRRLIGPKLFIVARLHHKCPLHLVFQFSDQVPVSRPNINYVVFATLTRMAMSGVNCGYRDIYSMVMSQGMLSCFLLEIVLLFPLLIVTGNLFRKSRKIAAIVICNFAWLLDSLRHRNMFPASWSVLPRLKL